MDIKVVAVIVALWLFLKSSSSTSSGGAGGTTYVVQPNDSLSAIAAAQWGAQYDSYIGGQIIADANPQYFPGTPGGAAINLIQPGWTLTIPTLTDALVAQATSEQAANPSGG